MASVGRKIIVLGLLGYGGYLLYNQYVLNNNVYPSGQPAVLPIDNGGKDSPPPIQIVNEKDLINIKDLTHSKEHSPLYDSELNERVRIKHVYTTQYQNVIM